MERFKNILVGVDISEADRFVSDEPAGPSKAAIDRALWLARANSAHVLFMYVLDPSTIQVPADEQKLPDASADLATLTSNAEAVLSKLAEDARTQGVAAAVRVTAGKSWIEIIRQVLKNDHDLVVAGTRRFGFFRSMLFGSTGMKLLRKCPCPVWLTHSQPERIGSVLVAHDLKQVGDLAMELGCSMAQSHGSQLHVFHAIGFPEFDDALPSRVSAEYIAQSRANAEKYIAGQLKPFHLSTEAKVHLDYGPAYSHLLTLIERHNVDLLVMGTIARTGVAGFFTGNTAELLLPHIPCSVIAVKPPGFKSPVTLE